MKFFKTSLYVLTACFTFFSSLKSWSRNQILKTRAIDYNNVLPFFDYENIQDKGAYFCAVTNGKSWLRSPDITVGDNFVLNSVFAHFDAPSNSTLTLTIRDAIDDSVLNRQVLFKTGSLSLRNLFKKDIYLTLNFDNANLKLYSFGLTRIKEKVMTPADLKLSPHTLFYDSDTLSINFRLRFPAFVDVVIFDMNGSIVEYLEKNDFFTEGNYKLTWNPRENKNLTQASGIYNLYIKSISTDGKTTELSKSFRFVYK